MDDGFADARIEAVPTAPDLGRGALPAPAQPLGQHLGIVGEDRGLLAVGHEPIPRAALVEAAQRPPVGLDPAPRGQGSQQQHLAVGALDRTQGTAAVAGREGIDRVVGLGPPLWRLDGHGRLVQLEPAGQTPALPAVAEKARGGFGLGQLHGAPVQHVAASNRAAGLGLHLEFKSGEDQSHFSPPRGTVAPAARPARALRKGSHP